MLTKAAFVAQRRRPVPNGRGSGGLLALVVCSITTAAELDTIRPVAERHCLACHSSALASGGVNFEALFLHDPYAPASDWKRALNVLRAGEMPPNGAPQPSAAERDELVEGISAWLRANHPRNPAEGHVYARRLTRTEYTHTLRDLLGLPEDPFVLPEQFVRFRDYFKPHSEKMADTVEVAHWQAMNNPPLTRYPGIATLPADSRAEHGFANQGDQISLSPALLEKYFAIASGLVRHKLFVSCDPLFAPLRGDAVAKMRERLTKFLPKAFRRAVTKKEVERYLGIFELSLDSGKDPDEAVKDLAAAVLSSPHFLMRANEGMASRLSYFLWASMPDEELFAAGLTDEAEIERQVRRMLRDRKAKGLSEHFGVPWLRLNELAAVIPDFELFADYYNAGGVDRRRTAGLNMMIEALLLFETILVENRSVLELIDTDFTYLNHYLALVYGLDAECGAGLDPNAPDNAQVLLRRYGELASQWRRCQLDDRRRGGVLSLGSTLTVTSLPTRTSPIARGAWVADVIFNRPPPPPPPEVSPLGESSPEEPRTLRERLAQHRDDPNCSGCHQRIDPLGFALENYNAIGQWRETDSGLPVDASGRLPGGAEFDGVEGFKDSILERPELFVRSFVEQLLAYALGRELTAFDDPAVSDVLERADGYRLQDIVVAISLSEPFRRQSSPRARNASDGSKR